MLMLLLMGNPRLIIISWCDKLTCLRVICIQYKLWFFDYVINHYAIKWLCDKSSRLYQENFISQMEWAPFKSLLWNTNDSIASALISFAMGVSLWDRPYYWNKLKQRKQMPKIYDNIKSDFFDCRANTGFCFKL